MKRKGFVIVIVIAFLTILLLVAWVVIDIGCGEVLQTRMQNDSLSAYYVAQAGTEMMYARLRNRPNELPPQTLTGSVATRFAGGQTVGTFTARADLISTDLLGITSEGTVRGHKSKVSAKYKIIPHYTNGAPVGSVGPMTLYGQRLLGFRSWVRVDGPITSGSTITTNNYVQVRRGDILENQSLVAPSFWMKYDADSDTWSQKATYDTFGTGSYITDVNQDGTVTIADAGGDPANEAIFRTNDINSDGEVNDKDAFITYYTVELNKQALGLGNGESNHYEGDQAFGPGDVPQGRTIIFVNGNVNIGFNDQNWSGYACDHTIAATGDIMIVQPTNGSDDRLTLVAYGDVNTGGVRAFGGVRGNLDIYANGDFNAYFGGRTNGTILAKDNVYIDTVLPIPGLLNRDINRGTDNWDDPANRPLGLPIFASTVPPSLELDESQRVLWERN